ncbi:phosphatase PAP2 family protein [Trinickia fusca]|uniref:Phosphatase PAP2 family protein n=1 Tax=Trinickia fusca TaxID=2419777 RepID=A0A494XQZ0_9BURK|nr:phosphatase PAP2 family protein [Trinickia fusca]RKP52232.1 phosphatase PAP2 family protein [Trinickia fusca]
MHAFDTRLIALITGMGQHSPAFTHAVEMITNLYVCKGLVLMALLWWVWFRHERADARSSEAVRHREREIVVVAIASGLIALAAGRLLAHYMPFRLRPIYEPQLQSLYPVASIHELLPRTWSAFPSDHAMLWSAIATGIFLASRPVGLYAWLHTLLLIGLPRIYLGLHYPSDVLAGCVLGFGIACMLNAQPVRTRLAAPFLAFAERYPGTFFAAAFALSFELTTQFDELRLLAHGVTHMISI